MGGKTRTFSAPSNIHPYSKFSERGWPGFPNASLPSIGGSRYGGNLSPKERFPRNTIKIISFNVSHVKARGGMGFIELVIDGYFAVALAVDGYDIAGDEVFRAIDNAVADKYGKSSI